MAATLTALGASTLATGPAAATSAVPAPAAASAPVPAAPAGAQGQAGPGGAPTAESELPARLTAGSWLVADAGTGEILAAKGPRVRDLPASTMKILTALVVLPTLSPETRVVVGTDAAEVDGTKVGLLPGNSYLVRDLATAMLISSGNDATVALVNAAGGRAAVLARMNALAAELGATDTVAGDPTGLDAPGQLTSVRDLAILGRAALAEPAVSRYLTIPRAALPTRDGGRFEIQNHNLLLGTYEGTLGVKNGYTVAAGATFVGAARRGERTLLVALLRAAPNYGADARALLDWGFAHDGQIRPIGTLPAPRPPTGPQDDGAVAVGGPASAAARPTVPGGQSSAGQSSGGQSSGGEGSGVGWVTWTALAITVVALVLTALGHHARQRPARRRARLSHRPRHRRGQRRQAGHRPSQSGTAGSAKPTRREPRLRLVPSQRRPAGRAGGEPAGRSRGGANGGASRQRRRRRPASRA
ncbi:D-alanyl-D-alanine carboxypeptidase [Frankia sp. CNm7]|uniref:D-alanyl-D-alanine carboxypeptidase n=2 Tax=Frankia nepalensis TaxID=1836974 RepID=A0A937RE78_9ACTN|nr:D-alanyl-D-alanine carboxypeptidase [Frankia nepalensis]MBL7516148.1 D-alanyl-D-alanine carboxypeptidase [Frankia nepalensis]MBL7517943.1 D-alanyl-D-alanine carboxypeptidase [Frankia nepalensis]MBL7627244.1 D-alanyl-D-alanine carboxypeptidase [Frankia nepalensis]